MATGRCPRVLRGTRRRGHRRRGRSRRRRRSRREAGSGKRETENGADDVNGYLVGESAGGCEVFGCLLLTSIPVPVLDWRLCVMGFVERLL